MSKFIYFSLTLSLISTVTCGSDVPAPPDLGPAANVLVPCALGDNWQVIARKGVEATVWIADDGLHIIAREINTHPILDGMLYPSQFVPEHRPILQIVSTVPLKGDFHTNVNMHVVAPDASFGPGVAVRLASAMAAPIMNVIVADNGLSGRRLHTSFRHIYGSLLAFQEIKLDATTGPVAIRVEYARNASVLRARAKASLEPFTGEEDSQDWSEKVVGIAQFQFPTVYPDEFARDLYAILSLAEAADGEQIHIVFSKPENMGSAVSLLDDLLTLQESICEFSAGDMS